MTIIGVKGLLLGLRVCPVCRVPVCRSYTSSVLRLHPPDGESDTRYGSRKVEPLSLVTVERILKIVTMSLVDEKSSIKIKVSNILRI